MEYIKRNYTESCKSCEDGACGSCEGGALYTLHQDEIALLNAVRKVQEQAEGITSKGIYISTNDFWEVVYNTGDYSYHVRDLMAERVDNMVCAFCLETAMMEIGFNRYECSECGTRCTMEVEVEC